MSFELHRWGGSPGGRGRHFQQGQAMAEYLVVAALLTAIVAVPVAGSESAVSLMLEAIRDAWSRLLGALSLPT